MKPWRKARCGSCQRWKKCNFDGFADKEWYFVFFLHRTQFIDTPQDAADLLRTQGRSDHLAAVLLGVTQKTEHVGNITNDNRDLTDKGGFNQYISRIRNLLFGNLLTVTDRIDFFGRNQHLRNILFQVAVADFGFDVLFYLILLASDRTNYIPLFRCFAHGHKNN